jgi:hypothetical protein
MSFYTANPDFAQTNEGDDPRARCRRHKNERNAPRTICLTISQLSGRLASKELTGGAMRIQTDQKIVGYPAVQVRQLMRETVGRPITPRYVREILRCSDSSARRVMRRLETEGFARSLQGHLEPSIKGSALAMAKAAPPLRHETPERLISDVIDRARAVNRDEKWAYRIRRLVIFGSCVRGAERPSDVDIACELVPRFKDEEQRTIEQIRRSARDQAFRNVAQWASWPRLEVLRFLKRRARGLSIHELDDWTLKLEDHRIIFSEQNKTVGNCSQW